MIDRKRVRELSQSAGPSQRKKSKVTASPLADEIKQIATEIKALPIGEIFETEPFRARVERLSKMIAISKRRGRPILPPYVEPFVKALGRLFGTLKAPHDPDMESKVRADVEKLLTELSYPAGNGPTYSFWLVPPEGWSGEPLDLQLELRRDR
jgi:hypothetical protein